ncbi:hypothetical protein [Terracidiphilus gabretensis]|uniref:hypothetical protein n=1 Tax=Terracidiphilus gabretensis TaxID=1577687 RepID=UPI00071B1413|nr:hypothetical protein [Terracidiphilus gabretensis]
MIVGPQYHTVFEIGLNSIDWSFARVGVALFVVGIGVIWLSRRYHWQRFSRRLLGYFLVLFSLIWLMGTLGFPYSQYRRLASTYRSGGYSMVEGEVDDFKPMPYEGHTDECFSVSFKRFCYSDFDSTAGFHNSSSHGGPIKQGIYARVFYIGNTIVRLDVADGDGDNAEVSASRANAAEADWQQRMRSDPAFNQMNLGFAIAAVFFTAWWNLQPQRFMKFWGRRQDSGTVGLLFRLFFALNFAGSIYYLISTILQVKSPNLSYPMALETGALMITVTAIMVLLVERINKRRDQSS